MKLRPWQEHPAARDDYLDAVAWYEDQEAGLGERLANSLDAAVDFARQWPESAPLYRGSSRTPQVRRKGVDVFPYEIIYLVRNDELAVVAYAHSRRRPGYWRRRLRDL